MQTFDPTNEPRGYHVYPAPTRRLRRFDNINQSAKSCKALTPCVAIMPDGSQVIFRKTKDNVTTETIVGKTINIRRRTLKTDIATTLDRAERLGLNLTNVAQSYRNRRDNGYTLDNVTETNETYSFHGAEV